MDCFVTASVLLWTTIDSRVHTPLVRTFIMRTYGWTKVRLAVVPLCRCRCAVAGVPWPLRRCRCAVAVAGCRGRCAVAVAVCRCKTS